MRRPANMLTRLTRLGIAAALGIAMVGMTAGRAAACRCAPLDEAQAIAAADVAFEGQVSALFIHPFPHDPVVVEPPLIYQFTVDTPLKGPIGRGAVNVSAEPESRGCGIEFVVGERWIILATVLDATTLTTTSCSGSRLADQQELAIPVSLTGDRGLPPQVLVAGVVLVALIGVSAWAFGFLRARRPR